MWNNWAVATSELGWQLTGFDQVVCATALRRARLWRLDWDDLYRYSFQLAVASGRHFSGRPASRRSMRSTTVARNWLQ